MGRRPRVEYSGAIYHVIQRGNNREYIFQRTEDKLFLLNELQKRKRLKEFLLFGYVLMGNHYHLILQTTGISLSKLMHLINSSYGRYYNKSRKRTGHIFNGRYKAIPIQNEQYLFAVLRYIHQNPVKAGICQRVQHYKWSSDIDYRDNQEGLVDINILLNMMSDNRAEAIKKYSAYVEQEDEEEYDEIDVLGDESFVLAIQPSKKSPTRKDLDQILRDTNLSSTDFEHLKRGSRRRDLIRYKVDYVREALLQGYTLKEIGENIGISATAVIKLTKR
ncbi:REP-associated tyrosine transposase [Desulforamulus aquiferis]|uniref:Transposase n=1 Tax=Desulforamulus aquiferis TaxID=1397668 RepID=A0AAW7ZGX5_9FIRM|nr:transposase [Desulforamulus aquiferis]MDO7788643.1 transposase [Desulforamulus aquiferis]